MRITGLTLAALLAMPLCGAIQEPVKIEGGLISGTPGWGWGIREYLGIPFAAPPTGNLRWRPPQPVVGWQGVRAADRFSAACMQRALDPNSGSWNRGLINTSEDCLYLNVWTSASSASERLQRHGRRRRPPQSIAGRGGEARPGIRREDARGYMRKLPAAEVLKASHEDYKLARHTP